MKKEQTCKNSSKIFPYATDFQASPLLLGTYPWN